MNQVTPPPRLHPHLPRLPGKPTRSPSLFVGLGLCVVLVSILVFVVNPVFSRRNTVMIDGRPMSRAEQRESQQEIYELLKNATPGKAGSANLDYPVKTDVGKRLKAELVKMDTLTKGTEAELVGLDFDLIMAAKRLGTEAGRAKSLAEIAKYRKVYRDYYQSCLAATQRLGNLVTSGSGKPLSHAYVQSQGYLERLSVASEAAFQSYSDVVAHTETTKPTVDRNTLAFGSDEQQGRYISLLEKVDKSVDAWLKLEEEYMAAQQSAFARGMDQLSGG